MNQQPGKSGKLKIAAYALLTLVYLAVVLTLAVVPLSGIGLSTDTSLYFIHAFEFFILAVLLFGLFSSLKSSHPYLFTLAFVMFIGIFTEIAQLFVPYRSFSLFDLAADFAGAAFIFVRKVV